MNIKIFLLVIYVFSGNGNISNTLEFNTKENCEKAREEITKNTQSLMIVVRSSCVEK